MKYELKHIGTLPKTNGQPAFTGDPIAYIGAIVTIAASEGEAAAPVGARARLCVRPEGETAWLYCGTVADLTRADVKRAFELCISDPETDRMEVDVKWLTDAEDDALPDFDGW